MPPIWFEMLKPHRNTVFDSISCSNGPVANYYLALSPKQCLGYNFMYSHTYGAISY